LIIGTAMKLEWRLRIALWLLRRTGGGRRLHMMTPAEARAALRAQTVGARAERLHGRLPAMADVQGVRAVGPAGDIPIRIYRPRRELGTLVFFHGGGFVTGGIDEADIECRRLAHASGRMVCSVGYRLAPEHRFPAAVDDALAAFTWLAERGLARHRPGRDGRRR
jgi:acetyl esterase